MESRQSFFSPARGLKHIFRKPVTLPMEDIVDSPRVGPENSRGYHVNDWNICIGCGTCSEICPANAITMVERDDVEDRPGTRNERPAIDYGRCCYCGLCVDICTTGSLNMTREYLCNSNDPEFFYRMPTSESINDEGTGLGYQKTESSDLLDLERANMKHEPAEERRASFMEIVRGYSRDQALIEASRCVECGLCTETCPAGMNIPEYINSVWKGDLSEGLGILYEKNPLSGVCGSICTHNCESVCSIGKRGEPVAIRWLKRYIIDNVEDDAYEKIMRDKVSSVNSGRVAIVGGGAAGLTAAYYLRTMGYDIDVYESKPLVGGVARYGIPAYRLPEDRLDKDIDFLERIGIRFNVNTRIGPDISLEDLKEDHDAVFLAAGLPRSRMLEIPGAEHEDVNYAMKFLAQARDYVRGTCQMPDVHEKAIVVGGGNVAFDVARTLERLQQERYGKTQVNMVTLETRDFLPADIEEIEEGEEEGLFYNFGFGPKSVMIEDGKMEGLNVVRCLSVFDEEGRFNPLYDDKDESFVEGSQIIVAVGQMSDHIYFTKEVIKKIEMNRGKIMVDSKGNIQGLPWLFAGGDIVRGPDVIGGVRDGHRAALGIDEYLRNRG